MRSNLFFYTAPALNALLLLPGATNIFSVIPALPMLAGIFIWGGLALVFILFGK